VFNETGYTTRQELLGDIQLIIEDALQEQMEINPNEYSNYSALLVIADLFEKTYIYEMHRMLFTDMGFSKVGILQVPHRPLSSFLPLAALPSAFLIEC